MAVADTSQGETSYKFEQYGSTGQLPKNSTKVVTKVLQNDDKGYSEEFILTQQPGITGWPKNVNKLRGPIAGSVRVSIKDSVIEEVPFNISISTKVTFKLRPFGDDYASISAWVIPKNEKWRYDVSPRGESDDPSAVFGLNVNFAKANTYLDTFDRKPYVKVIAYQTCEVDTVITVLDLTRHAPPI